MASLASLPTALIAEFAVGEHSQAHLQPASAQQNQVTYIAIHFVVRICLVAFQDGTIMMRRPPTMKIELVLCYDEAGTYRALQRVWSIEFHDPIIRLVCDDIPDFMVEVRSNHCDAFAFIIEKRITRSLRTLNLRVASIRTELVGMKSRSGGVICSEVVADGVDPVRLYEQLLEARDRAKVLETAISIVKQ